MPRDAPVTRATLPVRSPMRAMVDRRLAGRPRASAAAPAAALADPRGILPAPPEEAEEIASLTEAPAHELPVAQHLRAERDHLARPEVEAAVEPVHRVEDLGARQVRIAERALLHARGV